MQKLSKKYTNLLYIVFLIIAIFYMLIYPNIIINSIKKSLSVFIQNVLPTLFVFILCSQMIIMLNGARIMGYPLLALTRMLKLDDCTAGAYAASLIGGYPSGAASLALLYDDGELKKKYLVSIVLCSNCGPMFAIGTVGTVMLNSYAAGIVILLCHIAGGIINAFLFSWIGWERSEKPMKKKTAIAKQNMDFLHILDRCIINTAKIMIKIFAFMALFKIIGDAVFANDARIFGDYLLLEVLFRGSLELMDGSISAANLGFYQAATAICIIVSFGGLSAVFQTISVAKEIPFNRPMYFLGKVMHGMISGVLCYVFIGFVPHSVPAYADVGQQILDMQLPVPTYIFLLIFFCAAYAMFRAIRAKR